MRVPAVRARRRRQTFALTPFVMADVRPAGVPATVPGFPSFAETHLRAYVRREDGRDGIWFLSIEVARPLMPSERDVWLTSRRRAYTRRPGRLRETAVEHEPWPLPCAAVDMLEETPTDQIA
ncbi:DUF2071 domain-containing protein [Streptomyces canus]|uniref:DUF2071 domain-containing protein n=1 Tax=Streptomyces canus TaxID=58343 RepID=UPI003F6CE862